MAAIGKTIDWDSVELHYRAGIRTLKDLSAEYGVSDAGILKRAKRDGWERNIQAKIKAKVEAKVSAAAVSGLVSEKKRANQSMVIEANAEIIAQADLINRADVKLAMDTSRSQLEEVALLCDPQFKATLVKVGEMLDESYVTERGAEVRDKMNELYRYVISLEGRVKLSKDIAAAHGVYIPMQRKILKLDAEANQSQSQVDSLLARINAATD